jgi:uncharacterized protein (DUF58 family)
MSDAGKAAAEEPAWSAVTYPMRPVQPTLARHAGARPTPSRLDMSELAALGSLPLRARRLADAVGPGRHRSRRKGASVEFADYRDYQPGDDLRRVDWRLYGRTDRVQIRDAHEETPLRVLLLLDVSASMIYSSRPGLLTKLDMARSVLGALALLVRRQRDACGIGLLTDNLLRYLPPGGSPARLRAVWGTLDTPILATPTALASALEQAVAVAPPACLFIIASDFYEDPAALDAVVRRMRFERHDALALQVIDPQEEDFDFSRPVEFADSEAPARLQIDPVAAARAYRSAFAAHRHALTEVFRGSGFDHLALRTDSSPLAALAAYLARRAGRA